MNKKNPARMIILGLLITFSPNLFAQCPSGDVILSSQAEVNTFVADYGSCAVLPGSLTIGDDTSPIVPSNINDISGLSSLTQITGNLIISANPMLSSLSGLDNISSVDLSLQILDNDNLSDISGLDAVSTVGQQFEIIGNDALTSISGLNNLNVMLSVAIRDNDNLLSISGLNNLDSGRGLVIDQNINLTTITGINNHNPGIATAFMDNPNLSDISGFSVVGSTSALIVKGNSSLDICTAEGLCTLVALPISRQIENNGANCSSISDVIDQCLAALPVTLISFNAAKNENVVNLNWATAQERNNAGFFVQYSRDAQHWIDLSFINGQGNSDRINDYNYTHQDVLGSKNYYRLKQMDFDGQYDYSEIKIVKFESNVSPNFAQVFPNPSSGQINVQFEPTKNANSIIRLSDIRGEVIWEEQLLAERNPSIFFEQLDLPTNQLYFLFVQSGSQTQVIKIQTINE